MTLITFDNGGPVFKDGKVGAEQGCCCGQTPCTCTDCHAFRLTLGSECIWQGYDVRTNVADPYELAVACGEGGQPLFGDDCTFDGLPAFCWPSWPVYNQAFPSPGVDFCDEYFLASALNFVSTYDDLFLGLYKGPFWTPVVSCGRIDVEPIIPHIGGECDLDPPPGQLEAWDSATCDTYAWPCICCSGTSIKVRVYFCTVVNHDMGWDSQFCVSKAYVVGQIWYQDYEGSMPSCEGEKTLTPVGDKVYPDKSVCDNAYILDGGRAANGSSPGWETYFGTPQNDPTLGEDCGGCDLGDLKISCHAPNCFP